MLLALDDTDGPDGGCTTHVATRILAALGTEALAAPARLVRLHPANRWKTRGNAAVVLPLRETREPEATLEAAWQVVTEHARVSAGKGAGLALFQEPPEEAWYWRGVQGMIPMEEARVALEGVATRSLGTGRGRIGCLAAAAWRPQEGATWELIAYREPERVGTLRQVDATTLHRIQATFPHIFDCVDATSGHACMVPRTPCPVLFGLRGDRRTHLDGALGLVASEPIHATTLFQTNQASDHHIRPSELTWCRATRRPEALPGGHVRLETESRTGEAVTCLAYEPTGRLRHAVLAIRPGDHVLPVGSRHEARINLEKILHAPAPTRLKPDCPHCQRPMASQGRRAPLKCPGCSHRAPATYTRAAPRWYEADASARRHLARPLALGLAPHVARAAQDVPSASRPGAVPELPQ